MFWVHILSSPDFLIYAVPADVYYFVHSFAVLNKSIFKKNESTWKRSETWRKAGLFAHTRVYCLKNVVVKQSFCFPIHINVVSWHFYFLFQNHFKYLFLTQLMTLRVCDVCKISNNL